MGQIENVGEKLVEKAAIVAREELEKRSKVHDGAAVKLEIRVRCHVGLEEYAPPLRVFVNGVALPLLLNDTGSGEKNRLVTWCEVPVKVKGPDPIVITLEPVGSAAGFFRNGKSKKQRYRPAYTRNHIEAHGGEFSVPPKTDDYDPHVIEMNIGAKWRGLFGTRGPSGVIDRWRVEQGMATQTRDAGETTFGTQAP